MRPCDCDCDSADDLQWPRLQILALGFVMDALFMAFVACMMTWTYHPGVPSISHVLNDSAGLRILFVVVFSAYFLPSLVVYGAVRSRSLNRELLDCAKQSFEEVRATDERAVRPNYCCLSRKSWLNVDFFSRLTLALTLAQGTCFVFMSVVLISQMYVAHMTFAGLLGAFTVARELCALALRAIIYDACNFLQAHTGLDDAHWKFGFAVNALCLASLFASGLGFVIQSNQSELAAFLSNYGIYEIVFFGTALCMRKLDVFALHVGRCEHERECAEKDE